MSFLNALVTLLETVKKYKFVPGVVESWVVIIDCTDVVILDFMKVASVPPRKFLTRSRC